MIEDMTNGKNQLAKPVQICMTHCQDQCKLVRAKLDELSKARKTPRRHLYPSKQYERLSDLRGMRDDLVSSMENLKTVYEQHHSTQPHPSQAQSKTEPQKYINMAHYSMPNLCLNFDIDSSEKKLRDIILHKITSSEVVGAPTAVLKSRIVQGPGSVGKTQTIFAIAHLQNTRDRYPGGVFVAHSGQKQRRAQLLKALHSSCPNSVITLVVLALALLARYQGEENRSNCGARIAQLAR